MRQSALTDVGQQANLLEGNKRPPHGSRVTAGPPGKIEFFAQPLVFASQSCVVAFEPFDLRAQSGYFLSLLLNPFFGGLRFRPVGHATVMPELPIQYKSNRVEPGNQIRRAMLEDRPFLSPRCGVKGVRRNQSE